jgi:hypothetical protein
MAGATPRQVVTAFRRRAKVMHPDVNDAEDATARFAALVRAYHLALDAACVETSRRLDAPSARGPVPDPVGPTLDNVATGPRVTTVWDHGQPVFVVGPATVQQPYHPDVANRRAAVARHE